ncbi:MAG: hypothetical protein R3F14_26805 [Polyangiaceae bacterium]
MPVSTEAKVFEGRRYKYKLRTPAGTPWRALPDVLVGQRAQGADMGIERAGGGAVAVITSSTAPLVTMKVSTPSFPCSRTASPWRIAARRWRRRGQGHLRPRPPHGLAARGDVRARDRARRRAVPRDGRLAVAVERRACR